MATLVAQHEWVLLVHRLPRQPSTSRIALWRSLRRLGVVQVADGVVALPADARITEALEWLAEEVLGAGGEGTLWRGRPASGAQERPMATRMAVAVAQEYAEVQAAARMALSDDSAGRRRSLGRLRRELRRIAQCDLFPPPERAEAYAAVEGLAAAVDHATTSPTPCYG